MLGYGNPARQDDGIGPAIVERIEALGLSGVTTDSNYQLSVEDAAEIAKHDAVIFVDAAMSGAEPYELRRVEPKRSESFSTHSIEPESVLQLAHELFHSEASGYMLSVRGYSFGMFVETMTERAGANLNLAVDFLITLLKSKSMNEVVV